MNSAQTPGSTATASLADKSLGELVATATRDLSLLVHKEVELAKAEIKKPPPARARACSAGRASPACSR
jgi:hypothetical protein